MLGGWFDGHYQWHKVKDLPNNHGWLRSNSTRLQLQLCRFLTHSSAYGVIALQDEGVTASKQRYGPHEKPATCNHDLATSTLPANARNFWNLENKLPARQWNLIFWIDATFDKFQQDLRQVSFLPRNSKATTWCLWQFGLRKLLSMPSNRTQVKDRFETVHYRFRQKIR